MKYFSTFSGIGGFELGIESVIPSAKCVGFSEIEKRSIEIYLKHFPNHKNYGDITQIDIDALPDFDLLVGGSPCQDLSIAKANREGLQGARSKLFYKFVEILQNKKPKYFILENVASMSKENQNIISDILGCRPIMINASLVSAQSRKRLFWANFAINQPKDKKIYLKDIIENGIAKKEKAYCLRKNCDDWGNTDYIKRRYDKGLMNLVFNRTDRIGGKNMQGYRIYSTQGKSVSQNAKGGGHGAKTGLYLINDIVRKLTVIECERLQGFPDHWTDGIPNSKRYEALGNAVNVDVIKHIAFCLINQGEVELKGQIDWIYSTTKTRRDFSRKGAK